MLILQRDFNYSLIGKVGLPNEVAIIIGLEGEVEMFIHPANWTTTFFFLW